MTNDPARKIMRGYGSEKRPLTRILLARDSRPLDAALRDTGNCEPARPTVDYARYYDPDYARAEIDKLWMKTWLYAAREEDLPKVGDRLPFQVGSRSFLIVRSGAHEFKAFFNSCLHRGTQLCHKPHSGDSIVCPFHAWEWKLDGSLRRIPGHWDFPEVRHHNARLREVKLGLWGGFIFINADPEAAPLERALSVLPVHFEEFAPQKRYTAAHFRKLAGANWKVLQEAFFESYHIIGTHPEAVPFAGDSQTQYDVWGTEQGHIGRLITPSAVPGMQAPVEASSFDAAKVYAEILTQWHYPGAPAPVLDPAGDLRAQLADCHRKLYAGKYGREPNVPDSQMIDSVMYHAFPNYALWLSEYIPFVYQFMPHERDPELSYFDVRLLLPVSEGATAPSAAPRVEIGLEETIADKAPAFSFVGQLLDQDMSNLPLVQAGMKSADPMRRFSTLGSYQESIIQHWHDVHDQYMCG
jgi:phenylpropionate dioxygenase-like ring-hydroxylating dioxygenase large terminal subunit